MLIFPIIFSEEFVEGDRRKIKSLNPNRKTHREIFIKNCEELLDAINIENELNEVTVKFNIEKLNK